MTEHTLQHSQQPVLVLTKTNIWPLESFANSFFLQPVQETSVMTAGAMRQTSFGAEAVMRQWSADPQEGVGH